MKFCYFSPVASAFVGLALVACGGGGNAGNPTLPVTVAPQPTTSPSSTVPSPSPGTTPTSVPTSVPTGALSVVGYSVGCSYESCGSQSITTDITKDVSGNVIFGVEHVQNGGLFTGSAELEELNTTTGVFSSVPIGNGDIYGVTFALSGVWFTNNETIGAMSADGALVHDSYPPCPSCAPTQTWEE